MLEVLCQIVRCPVTGGPLVPLERSELQRLNTRIADGSVRHADGSLVDQPLSQAVRTPDARLVYRFDGGMLALLPQLAVLLDSQDQLLAPIGPDKETVRAFYDTFGWRRQGRLYGDTLAFANTRRAAMRYLERCHRRVRRRLPSRGRFLLDAASGPVQHEEVRRFSEGFDFHVCVDLSPLALREARRNLGDHGLYVLGDLTCLPFRDDVFDAAVCLHAIYHVPAQQQRAAFEEVHRVLQVGAPGVIVYRWADRPKAHPARMRRRSAAKELATPPLYAYAHSYEWFRSEDWPFEAEVRVWRSVSGSFLRGAGEGVGWRLLLWLLYRAEELAPRFAGRFGRFPMIVIRKRGAVPGGARG